MQQDALLVGALSEKSTNGRFNTPSAVPAPIRGSFRGLSLLAPGLAAWVARRVFLTPVRHRQPTRESWWATEAEACSLPWTYQGHRRELATWRWGWSGPVVVLVHGWAGRGLQMGAFAAPLVEAGYQVLAFDGPAHGQSDGSWTSLPEFAAACDAVLRHAAGLGNGSVAGIVAHSFGAAAATLALSSEAPALFGRAPQKVEKLAFVAPATDLFQVTEQFSHLTGFTAEVVERMRRGLERRFDIRWARAQPKALAADMRQPLLVVHDHEDGEIPWHHSRTLARLWPGARLRSTRGLGHSRILRDGAVVTAVARFLGGSESHSPRVGAETLDAESLETVP